MRSRLFELSPVTTRRVPCWAAILVSLLDPLEVAIGKRTIAARRALPDRHMRIDAFLLNHPAKHCPCSVRRVAHQASGFETKALFDSIDHRLGGLHLLRSMCRCGFNIDNDSRVQVDQIVCRVGEECGPTGRRSVASTAKPSPSTRPSFMQRRKTDSKTCRNAPLSRNRP